VPLMPSRVTLHYAKHFGDGGLVAADPGTSGYWVARTFATTEPRSVLVPAEPDGHGMAVACCLVAQLRRPTRRALAVVDAPVSEKTHELLEAAAGLGVAVPVEVWLPDGERAGAGEHEARLRRAATGTVHGTFEIATRPGQIDAMIDAAGPVVAWT